MNGTAQTDPSVHFGRRSPAYYGYSLNPFRNYLITGKANLQLTEQTAPRYRALLLVRLRHGRHAADDAQGKHSVTGPLQGGIADINSDGDTLDTVTGLPRQRHRNPPPRRHDQAQLRRWRTTSILGGFWYERARHRQTAPATTVDNNGNIGDRWLEQRRRAAALRRRLAVPEPRRQSTVSTGESVFLQDTDRPARQQAADHARRQLPPSEARLHELPVGLANRLRRTR